MRVLEFTAEQMGIIRELKRREFADATPEEIELYAQWTSAQALDSEEFKAETEIKREQAQAETEMRRELAQASLSALEAQRDLALQKLAELRGE